MKGRAVIRIVADHFGLTVADLESRRKTYAYSRPRQIAMWLMRRHSPHLSYPDIGRLLGGRDHTTIIHGVRNITVLIEKSPGLAELVDTIEEAIRQVRPNTLLTAQIIAAERHVAALRALAAEECGRDA